MSTSNDSGRTEPHRPHQAIFFAFTFAVERVCHLTDIRSEAIYGGRDGAFVRAGAPVRGGDFVKEK